MKPATLCMRLKETFPDHQGPAAQDICYATENRQVAVKAVVPLCEMLLVVGSQNSSNSSAWWKFAKTRRAGHTWSTTAREVDPAWLERHPDVAVTAGASAPENLVRGAGRISPRTRFRPVEEMEVKEEDVRFSLARGAGRAALQLTNCRPYE